MHNFRLSTAITAMMNMGHSHAVATEMALQQAVAAESWHRYSFRGMKQRPYPASNSIAGQPHKNLREIARRKTKPGTLRRYQAMTAARARDEAGLRRAIG